MTYGSVYASVWKKKSENREVRAGTQILKIGLDFHFFRTPLTPKGNRRRLKPRVGNHLLLRFQNLRGDILSFLTEAENFGRFHSPIYVSFFRLHRSVVLISCKCLLTDDKIMSLFSFLLRLLARQLPFVS
ncbi:hypothetical protein NIES2100_22610 [Calothrix sp. NIES-2100]|nr:hypothetical protein NIES2100_22610 [Calothrix sp. NIES-2100]